MKRKKELIRLFSILFLILAVAACDSNNGGGDTMRVLTENDFANDENLAADPELDTVVKFLEPPGDDIQRNQQVSLEFVSLPDTGTTGTDSFNISYNDTTEHTFCWEDDNEEAGHTLELKDIDENIILSLNVNDCTTEIIEAGDYILTLTHDGLSDIIHSIFMVPSKVVDAPAAKANGIKAYVSNILENLFTSEVNAQPLVGLKVQYTLTTRSCAGCNLAGGNFAGADLTSVNLAGADITGGNLTSTNLTKTNLAGANLTGSVLTQASMVQINLTGADLTGATWCDGSICSDGSTGTCELPSQYLDNCNNTISDNDNGIMWEKKDGDDGNKDLNNPNDVDNEYSWSTTGTGVLNGSVVTEFLAQLNDDAGGGMNCFASHCDWRLPSINELKTILDLNEGACGGGSGACINPIFEPTAANNYWSSTTSGCEKNAAGLVSYGDGFIGCLSPKNVITFVRAVRDIP